MTYWSKEVLFLDFKESFLDYIRHYLHFGPLGSTWTAGKNVLGCKFLLLPVKLCMLGKEKQTYVNNPLYCLHMRTIRTGYKSDSHRTAHTAKHDIIRTIRLCVDDWQQTPSVSGISFKSKRDRLRYLADSIFRHRTHTHQALLSLEIVFFFFVQRRSVETWVLAATVQLLSTTMRAKRYVFLVFRMIGLLQNKDVLLCSSSAHKHIMRLGVNS